MLYTTISVSLLCQLALIYVPLLQHVFQTEALNLRDLSKLLALAAMSLMAHEARRWWERKVQARELYESTIGDMA
jgi:Ca2+-transporting ATPase